MELQSLSTLEELLQRNSDEYKQHLTTRNRITKALNHQNNIRIFKTVPKRLRPPTTLEVFPPNSDLTKQFEEEFHQLLFCHLNRVITHNTITLELENARLRDIATRTDTLFTTIDAPTETVKQLKTKFYSKNNLTQHINPTPTQQLPQASTPPSPAPSQNPQFKRKISCQPTARKCRKIEHHFLSQRHNLKLPT